MSIVSDSGDEKEFRGSGSVTEDALIGNGKVKKSLFKRKSKRVHVFEWIDDLVSWLLILSIITSQET